MSEERERALREEGSCLMRHLLREEPAPALLDRYARACGRLFPDPAAPRELALVAFAVRHPRALPCLDAAVVYRRRESLLRRKLIVAAALLETTPSLAPRFFGRSASLPVLAAITARCMWAELARATLGMLLLPIAERSAP